MNAHSTALSAVMLLTLSACPSPSREPPESVVYLNQITAAPVSLVAEVNHPTDARPTIRLSQGSVMGVSCTEGCYDPDDTRNQCQGVVISVSPPTLASVQVAHLPSAQEPRVLIGNEVGSGTVQISTACASNTYQITVVP